MDARKAVKYWTMAAATANAYQGDAMTGLAILYRDGSPKAQGYVKKDVARRRLAPPGQGCRRGVCS